MTHQSMDEYFRGRLKVELLKLDRMRAVATFPHDLQGPPEAGHGGGATALLLEMVRMVAGERDGEAILPRPLRLEVALHRQLPLDTPLRAEVVSEGGVWHSRILREDRLIVEAEVRPATAPLSPPPAALRRAWDARGDDVFTVPGYEWCLGCGSQNPRGAQVRFEYNDLLMWKRLSPRAHFRCGDGTLSLGYHCIVGDELGWWMGALKQGECGLSNRVVLTLGASVPHGTPLVAVGSRSAVHTSDPKGRTWQARAYILTEDWQPVATADVQFVGSRAFTQTMLPRFIKGADLPSLQRAFPRYKDSLAETA